MAKKSTAARNVPFYLRVENVPEVHRSKRNLFTPTEDEKLPLPRSFENINYQNFSKLELINAYITLYNRIVVMEQNYSEMTVRNSILQDRLVVNGLPTTMDLEEIKNYRITLELALQNTLSSMKTKLPQDIKFLIENKVIEEVRKTQIDQGMLLEFQIFEISRQLKMNLELQAEVMASHEEHSKKSASIQKLQSAYDKLVNLMRTLKETGKDIDEAYKERANGIDGEISKSEKVESDEDDEEDFEDLTFDDFK